MPVLFQSPVQGHYDTMETTHGKLILLTTPIGNLQDLTGRVKEVLEKGIYFACEDTRTFKDLLGHLGISLSDKKLYAFHDHSQEESSQKFLDILQTGENLYVVSDAGSPVVSDPAYPLIKAVLKAGFEIDTYAGVSSV
ncbi:MAG: hypothetical protein KBD63_00005, partial [Bacteriovoracaceae bacterium]|nr:hypothetical protein [Bacteriovoracaceae bacterium]